INLGSNAMVGIYDPELFAQAGIEPPGPEWTWEDYIELGRIVVDKLGIHWATQFPGNFFHAFHHVLRQNGYPFYAPDGTGLGWKDDKLLEEFFRLELQLYKEGLFASPALRDEVSSVEQDLLVTRQAATAWAWSNQIVAMSLAANRPLGLITLPKAKDQVKEGLYIKPSMFFSVAESSPHKDAAVLFIDFFTNDVEANKILMAERGVPISSKVREALQPYLTDVQIQMFEYLDLVSQHSSPIDPPEPAGHPEVNRLLDDLQSMVLHEVITPAEAARTFRQEATRILRSK
ncbi:MAG: ABC transporter substrate-binding protein, partial [Limnochordia bacterium]